MSISHTGFVSISIGLTSEMVHPHLASGTGCRKLAAETHLHPRIQALEVAILLRYSPENNHSITSSGPIIKEVKEPKTQGGGGDHSFYLLMEKY